MESTNSAMQLYQLSLHLNFTCSNGRNLPSDFWNVIFKKIGLKHKYFKCILCNFTFVLMFIYCIAY